MVRKWIAKAIKRPGSLRRVVGVKKSRNIPAGKLSSLAKRPGVIGQKARLAKQLRGFNQ